MTKPFLMVLLSGMFLQNTNPGNFQVDGYWKAQQSDLYLKIQNEEAISYSITVNDQYHQNRYKIKWIDRCRFLLILQENKSNVFPEPIGTTYEFECNKVEGNNVLICSTKLLSSENNNAQLLFARAGKDEYERFRDDFKEKLKMALKSPVSWSIPAELINKSY